MPNVGCECLSSFCHHIPGSCWWYPPVGQSICSKCQERATQREAFKARILSKEVGDAES
jgi:hypothetical protein